MAAGDVLVPWHRRIEVCLSPFFPSLKCGGERHERGNPGHLRIRKFQKELFWTTVHQHRKRADPVLLQPAHICPGTGQFYTHKDAICSMENTTTRQTTHCNGNQWLYYYVCFYIYRGGDTLNMNISLWARLWCVKDCLYFCAPPDYSLNWFNEVVYPEVREVFIFLDGNEKPLIKRGFTIMPFSLC